MVKERVWTESYVGIAKICLPSIQVAFYSDVWLAVIYFRKLFLLLMISVVSFRVFDKKQKSKYIKLKSKWHFIILIRLY